MASLARSPQLPGIPPMLGARSAGDPGVDKALPPQTLCLGPKDGVPRTSWHFLLQNQSLLLPTFMAGLSPPSQPSLPDQRGPSLQTGPAPPGSCPEAGWLWPFLFKAPSRCERSQELLLLGWGVGRGKARTAVQGVNEGMEGGREKEATGRKESKGGDALVWTTFSMLYFTSP